MTRREFLGASAGAAVATALAIPPVRAAARPPVVPFTPDGLPLVDLHAHPDRSTIDDIVALARERGVTLGLVEHAGTKENVYPRLLSNDAELLAWVRELEGKGVYKGVQAEWIDWSSGISKRALAALDYVLGDAMTFPGPDGRRMKLWEKEAVIDDDAQRFMERYVDWHVRLLHEQPFDLLANVSWLPAKFAADYERLWTEKRVSRVVEAFARRGVAMEISSSYQLPKRSFLRVARAAGLKFTFGSNGRYPNMGKLDYSLEMARSLRLTAADIWLPGASGPRAAG
jgi:histidinol phosphatase-like PHP family hydrolase